MKNNAKIISDLKEQTLNYKQLLNNKDNYYKDQIDKCSSKLISRNDNQNKSSNENDEINRVNINK